MTDDTTHDDSADFIGLWCAEDNYVRQELHPGGRYVEARGNKEAAYTGACGQDTHVRNVDASCF